MKIEVEIPLDPEGTYFCSLLKLNLGAEFDLYE